MSEHYDEVRQRVVEQYVTRPTDPQDLHWWETHGKRWRTRVGVPRLTAEQVVFDARGMLSRIHLNTYRNDPELTEKLVDARAALEDLSMALATDSWRRFQGEDR